MGFVLVSTQPTAGAGTWNKVQLAPQQCDDADCFGPSMRASCAGEQFCAATDGTHLWVSANPAGGSAAWTESALPTAVTALACPAVGTCVVAGGGKTFTTTDAIDPSPNWTPAEIRAQVDTQPINGIACQTVELCVAINGNGGDVITGNPTTGSWTAAHRQRAAQHRLVRALRDVRRRRRERPGSRRPRHVALERRC
jgi:hypothetical protein